MPAGVFSFSGQFAIKLNSDFNYTLTYTNSANGQPVDLTGYEAKMSFGNNLPPSTTYLTLSSTGMSPAITFNPTQGQILLYVSQADIYTAFNAYLVDGQLNMDYDMLLYPPDDSGVDGFLQGTAQVLPGVTVP
jgi:hypothetical protein